MPASVLEGFLRSLRSHPDADAVVSRRVRLTYRQLGHLVVSMARMIRPAINEPGALGGVAVGDQVLHLALLLAVEAAGGASASLSRQKIEAGGSLDRLCRCFLVDEPMEPIEGKAIIHVSLPFVDDVMQRSVSLDPLNGFIHTPADGQITRCFSTSGTTGEPKLFALTSVQNTRCVYARLIRSWMGIVDTPHFLMCYLFGAESLYRSALACMMVGGTVTFGSPSVQSFHQSRANITWILPADLLRVLADLPVEGVKPAPLRLVTGGSSIAPRLRNDLTRLATDVVDLYSSNETAEIAWRSSDGPFRPYPDVEVAIIDPKGHAMAAGEVGAVAVRSPTIVSGYLDQPLESARAFRKGWFISSDLGMLDSDGHLKLVGRRDDLLNLSGRKVSPYPIEETLRGISGVADVICVDQPDPESGETALCIAVRVAADADREALLTRLSGVRYAYSPGAVRHRLFDEFPVTAAGKPDRRAIRRAFETPG